MELCQYFILIGTIILQTNCCPNESNTCDNCNNTCQNSDRSSLVTSSVILVSSSVYHVDSSASYGVQFPPPAGGNILDGFLNLLQLWEDATITCVKAKGVCVPEHYCDFFGGEALANECDRERYVCCLNVNTEDNIERLSPTVKNINLNLQHSDFLELRSKCVKSPGLLSHYCKDKGKKCRPKKHAHIGFDYFEWEIIGIGLSKWGNIKSGDTIALKSNDYYLNCNTKKCQVKKLKKCRFESSKAWESKKCIKATYKIYSNARQGNCTFDKDIVNDNECKGDVIRQGDEVSIISVSESGNYKLSNNPDNGPLSDVVLMSDISEGYDEQCSTWTVQLLSPLAVYAFPNA